VESGSATLLDDRAPIEIFHPTGRADPIHFRGTRR